LLIAVIATCVTTGRGFWRNHKTGVAESDGSAVALSYPSRHKRLLLILSISIVIIASACPLLPSLNPNQSTVSVDVKYYDAWLAQMTQKTPVGAIYDAFNISGGDRPLYLLLIYSAKMITGLPLTTLNQDTMFFLAPFTVLSSYIFVATFWPRRQLEALAAMTGSFSFQVTVGLYAGLNANWLALSFGLLLLVAIYRYYQKTTPQNLLVAVGASLLVLLTHSYVSDLLTATLVLLLVFSAFIGWRSRQEGLRGDFVRGLIVVVVVTLLFELAGRLLLGFGGVPASYSVVQGSFGPRELLQLEDNLKLTFTAFFENLYENILIFGLAIFGIIALDLRRFQDRVVLSYLVVLIIPILFASSWIQVSAIFDAPYQVLDALGLWWLSQRMSKTSFILLVIFIILTGWNYLFQVATQLPISLTPKIF